MTSISLPAWGRHLLVSGLALAALLGARSADAITPRALVEVVDFGAPVVSPAGDQVAFRTEQASIERNTHDTVWYVQAMDGKSPPRRVADGGIVLRDSAGIPLPTDVVWSPDGRWIYYRALFDGRIDIWRAATDGSGAAPVTRDPADIRDFSLERDGELLMYSVGATREDVVAAEQREYDAGIRIDGTVPIGQGLHRSGNTGGRLATERYDTTWFDRVPLLADVPMQWRAIDLATGARRALDADEVRAHEALAGPGEGFADAWRTARSRRDGRAAVLTRVGEPNGLRQRPDVQLSATSVSPKGPATLCSVELCTGQAITGIQWRPGRDEVLFTVTDPHAGLSQSLYRWDVSADMAVSVVRTEGFANGGRDVSSDCGASSTALACVTATPNQPPRLERIDIDTGERRILFEPNRTLAHQVRNSGHVRLLQWSGADGQMFTGQFYAARKRGDQALPPLFVTYYRCTGFVRGGVGDEWPLAVLADQGIAALCINAVPSVLDAVERYGNGLTAVASAVELLSSDGEIDCTRVGMGGLSFGSEVAMWVEMNSSMLSAVSLSSTAASPLYHLLAGLKGDVFSATLNNIWGLGAPDDTPARWRTLSPVFNLDAIEAPILFQLPEQEYMQILDYAIPLVRDRRAELYVFPHEPHQKFQPRHKLAIYERNLDWFRYWLLGVEDPHPGKQAQYAGWGEMRATTSPGSACPRAGSVLGTAADPVLDHAEIEHPHEGPVARGQGAVEQLVQRAVVK